MRLTPQPEPPDHPGAPGGIVQRKLKFEDCLHARPRPKGMDVICTLQHFSIITYAVDPVRFEGYCLSSLR